MTANRCDPGQHYRNEFHRRSLILRANKKAGVEHRLAHAFWAFFARRGIEPPMVADWYIEDEEGWIEMCAAWGVPVDQHPRPTYSFLRASEKHLHA